jgi:Glycosyl hydrolase family 79 C-terminal beta domain
MERPWLPVLQCTDQTESELDSLTWISGYNSYPPLISYILAGLDFSKRGLFPTCHVRGWLPTSTRCVYRLCFFLDTDANAITFPAPPTNESSYHQWTIRPTYYSALVVAETFGTSNTSQIIDLNANNGTEFTPAYAAYDGGVPTKVILFNYITDPSSTSNYNVIISIDGQNGSPNAIPASVQVKSVTTTPFLFVSMGKFSRYLQAPSVSEKVNTTWAGQVSKNTFH